MKSFKDFGIKPATKGLVGDKIKIEKILNRQITVHDFKIEPSKHNQGECLHMQIQVGEEMRVVFTGSGVLIQEIREVPKEEFPFVTTIVKENDRFEFN
jgi:hypothetical protein